MVRLVVGALAALVITSAPILAQDGKITQEMATADLVIKGQKISITRNLNPTRPPVPSLTTADRICPPACITPMQVAAGVRTVGELEVIDFLKSHVAAGNGLLLDTRAPAGFATGSIPGALNIPSETLAPNNPYRDEILRALGGEKSGNNWEFSNATELMMFCSGPWCEQSGLAIRALTAEGYPAQKIRYYRGGLQVWRTLGLTTTQPSS